MERHPWLAPFAVCVVVCTNAGVIIAVVGMLLWGLTTPMVDNDKVLAIVGPAFLGIIGSFNGIMGALGGFLVGKNSAKRDGVQ